jgi:hypothetical protein
MRAITARLVPVMLCAAVLCLLLSSAAYAQNKALSHGLWVWKGPATLAAPNGAENLRDFCRSQSINEVYISIPTTPDPEADRHFAHAIEILHRANIRVEALLSSTDADGLGKHRDKLLDHVREVIQFDQSHRGASFDGLHLDIEPQQRPENKGEGNLGFLPNLVDAYRAVLSLAEPAHLSVNADIQNKLLKGDVPQRRMLLTSLPGFTLMLYELSSPGDGQSAEQQMEKLRAASAKYLDMAYEGVRETNVATMAIGLRTPDYGDQLPAMLRSLDAANGANAHYAGWSRHSYNDTLTPEK